MASVRQLTANRQNAKRSTGPKTPTGKIKISHNAISHGIFAQQLLLDGERPEDYQSLLDGLNASLQPVGVLELSLVEKVAVALWRQRRLLNAERAYIEYERQPKRLATDIIMELRDTYSAFSEQHLQPPDINQVKWCKTVITEVESLPKPITLDMVSSAPTIYEQLKRHAQEDNTRLEDYLEHYRGGLQAYLRDVVAWCRETLKEAEQYPVIQAAVERAKARAVIFPEKDMDRLYRYERELDSSLYKALRALRDAQQWRLSSLEGQAEPMPVEG